MDGNENEEEQNNKTGLEQEEKVENSVSQLANDGHNSENVISMSAANDL